jgi:hypothetical protein
MQKALNKLKGRETKSPQRHPELDFLNKADLDMRGWEFDRLMDQGRKAQVSSAFRWQRAKLTSSAWRSGKEFKARYGRLLDKGEGVFSRSAGGARVVETGQYWMQVSNHGEKLSEADLVGVPK